MRVQTFITFLLGRHQKDFFDGFQIALELPFYDNLIGSYFCLILLMNKKITIFFPGKITKPGIKWTFPIE